MPEDAAVQVAVRVRPFNGREKAMNAKRCIDMEDKNTYVYEEDAEDTDSDPRTFAFDFSLWSHFDFVNEKAGENPDAPNRLNVDQDLAYEIIGKVLLGHYWDGYDVCMFAYGQSGAGKSFSMTGTGPKCAAMWKGIIPRICNDTFVKADELTTELETFKITASMLEIYVGKIYDLLIPPEEYNIKTRKELSMQLDSVNGLSDLPVKSEGDVTDLLVRGFGNQTKAPTGLNVDSSRGHTIFTLKVQRTISNPKARKKSEKSQTITTNMKLVDLAGSERTEKVLEITKEGLADLLTQKYGKPMTVSDKMMEAYKAERTVEGRSINNSLTSLGNCVKQVAKLSEIADLKKRKAKMDQIAWRASALTRLLRTALNGKCKTIMIAAVSPSLTEYPETVSTMRYANQIKQIKSTAVKQEAKLTTDQLQAIKIKELEEKLAAALSGGGGGGGDGGGGGGGGQTTITAKNSRSSTTAVSSSSPSSSSSASSSAAAAATSQVFDTAPKRNWNTQIQSEKETVPKYYSATTGELLGPEPPDSVLDTMELKDLCEFVPLPTQKLLARRTEEIQRMLATKNNNVAGFASALSDIESRIKSVETSAAGIMAVQGQNAESVQEMKLHLVRVENAHASNLVAQIAALKQDVMKVISAGKAGEVQTAVGKIYFKCLTCDQPIHAQAGPSSEQHKQATRLPDYSDLVDVVGKAGASMSKAIKGFHSDWQPAGSAAGVEVRSGMAIQRGANFPIFGTDNLVYRGAEESKATVRSSYGHRGGYPTPPRSARSVATRGLYSPSLTSPHFDHSLSRDDGLSPHRHHKGGGGGRPQHRHSLTGGGGGGGGAVNAPAHFSAGPLNVKGFSQIPPRVMSPVLLPTSSASNSNSNSASGHALGGSGSGAGSGSSSGGSGSGSGSRSGFMSSSGSGSKHSAHHQVQVPSPVLEATARGTEST
mmetsp:Transcript_41479/g.81338  ORF Transcript_41479/g.81338 Transcript_41479/m.81338 type:complete len:936 (+) Transcript_41479:90-2897(+)